MLNSMTQGTMRNPPPGRPVTTEHPDKEHELGQTVTNLRDPIARENFRVVIIIPDEVEQLDIHDRSKARRWKYSLVVDNEGQGRWHTEELWP